MSDPFAILEDDTPQGELPGKYRTAWVEDSLSVEASSHVRFATAHTRRYLGSSISRRTIWIFFLLITMGMLAIIGRVGILQIGRGAELRVVAEGNRIRLKPVPAERGIIFDRMGRPLVQNVPSFSLAVVPQDLPRPAEERRRVIQRLAELSGVRASEVAALLTKYGSYSYESLVIKENLDYETALSLYINNSSLPGVAIESGTKRKYAVDAATSTVSLAHVLGYVGKLNDEEVSRLKDKGYLWSDITGKTGVEHEYETALRGVYGRKKIEVNAVGQEQTVLAHEPPRPGNNIYLSIDVEAQSELERLLQVTAARHGFKRLAAIALNPQDGAIVALVSWPAYNNNDFSGGISTAQYRIYEEDADHPLFNRAISGTYPSGSTVKPVVAAAALQEKVVTRSTSFNSTGGLAVGPWFFADWRAGGHGPTNIIKALAWSVNTYFYYVGGGYNDFVGLGVDRLARYLHLFGLGQKTGVDLPGESAGLVPSKEWKKQVKGEQWYIGDTYNLSIGQGDLLVTPLQVAVWTAAVANGGNIIKPHVVHKIIDPVANKTVMTVKQPIVRQSVVAQEHVKVVQEGLRTCVTAGSCGMLRSLPFAAAGKTGTAQWSSTRPPHAWFTSFAPFDNPQIVVTVLVEEGGEGGIVAEPIARDWLAWWGKKYLSTR